MNECANELYYFRQLGFISGIAKGGGKKGNRPSQGAPNECTEGHQSSVIVLSMLISLNNYIYNFVQ